MHKGRTEYSLERWPRVPRPSQLVQDISIRPANRSMGQNIGISLASR